MDPRKHNRRLIEDVPKRVVPALGLLLEAMQYADQTSGDRWEFSVELDQLATLGLTGNDFRWLVRKGLIEHQREVTLEGDDGRAFRPTGDLTFSEATCFILTDAGVLIASQFYAAAGESSSAADEGIVTVTINRDVLLDRSRPQREPTLPTWNSDVRELRIDALTIKQFKWAAANQETILAAFEEEGWPRRIDDPLPPQPDQLPKRRLSDTIKCLNLKQQNRLIRFRGDGSGKGVTWEFVGQDGSDDLPSG